jgi:hypothetical protein
VANDDTSVGIPSAQVIDEFYEGVPVKGEMGRFETFYSNAKAKQMVGFAPQHGWRDRFQ